MKAKTVYRTIQTAVTAVILMLSACEPEAVPVNGVTLDRTTVNMMVGESVTLKAVVAPANATVKTVHWSAVPAGAATVKDHGDGRCTVTVEKEGSVTVLAATADGGKAAGCRLSAAWPRIGNTAFIKAVDTQCGWTVESDGTVKLTPENRAAMAAVTELLLDGKGLTDISGIEYFTGLTALNCSRNNLTSLDLSANTALMTLNCSSNKLTSLDMSGCLALTTLNCSKNNLTSLDLSGCTSLTTLDLTLNPLLTSLDMSGCTAFEKLTIALSSLTSLDLSDCTSLTGLSCSNNNLTSLDISGCTSLTDLSCVMNKLTTLDVSGCLALTILRCYENNLTELDVSGCTALTTLLCSDNQLTELDVSGCTALSRFVCSRNRLTILDITQNTNLRDLICGNQTSDGSVTQNLELFLTTEQKTTWESTWVKESANKNVTVKTAE